MVKTMLYEQSGVKIIAMDTISHVGEKERGQIVISASHGGISSAEYGIKVPLKAVFYNDAGIGKENAGIAALSILEENKVACGTVSHNTARIGDVMDMWENGIISSINKTAEMNGIKPGISLKVAVECLLENITP